MPYSIEVIVESRCHKSLNKLEEFVRAEDPPRSKKYALLLISDGLGLNDRVDGLAAWRLRDGSFLDIVRIGRMLVTVQNLAGTSFSQAVQSDIVYVEQIGAVFSFRQNDGGFCQRAFAVSRLHCSTSPAFSRGNSRTCHESISFAPHAVAVNAG